MMLPEIPGIIDALMTITPQPDGKVSLRVLIGADSRRPSGSDQIELIISPEHVSQALAGGPAGRAVTFPCHVGLHRDSADTAA